MILLWSIKNKVEPYYCSLLCLVLFGHPPTAMDAVLVTIVSSRRAIIVINIEAVNICLIYNLILNPSQAASPNPICRGSRGYGVFIHQNHAARGKTWLNRGGGICFSVFC